MSRPSDLIRTKLITDYLTGYLPAHIWDDAISPFTLPDSKILLTRQSGLPSNDEIRRLSVECWLFSKINPKNSDVDALFDDATTAMSALLTDYTAGGIFGISVTEDVTGPFLTGQNRNFYRFSLQTLVNS
jgi:hypothetical protein